MAIWRGGLAGIVLIVCGLQAPQVAAEDQTKTGAGNAAAIALAKKQRWILTTSFCKRPRRSSESLQASPRTC
jgi:hypothetical protein